MKRNSKAKLAGSLFAGLLLAFVTMGAYADAPTAGTLAGTDITNVAKVTYKVNGVTQTEKDSPPVTFKVDRKIVLTVTHVDTDLVPATPGSTTAVLKFKVKNTGNSPQGAILTAANLSGSISPFGTAVTDNFDPSAFQVYVDNPGSGTAGSYDSNDTATSIGNINPDAEVTVFIVATIPTSQVNGDIAGMSLTAQAAKVGGSAYTDAAGTAVVDESSKVWGTDAPTNADGTYNILADAAGPAAGDGLHDGKASALDAFKVKSSALTITKAATVVSDPVSGTTTPHAIPGAVMEYSITVANGADSTGDTATDISVVDDLTAQIITTPHFTYNTNSITVTPNGGSATACTDLADTDACKYDTSTHTVTVNGLSVAPGETTVVKFRVTLL